MPKILIVDDEHSQTEVLKLLFSLEGFEAAVAFNGKDALAQLERVRPDVIVTDYSMPLMNGGELVKLVRASSQHAKLPIVMTTATQARHIEHAELCNAILRKPYLWDDLIATVNRILPPPPPPPPPVRAADAAD